jgi:hypothetical protein
MGFVYIGPAAAICPRREPVCPPSSLRSVLSRCRRVNMDGQPTRGVHLREGDEIVKDAHPCSAMLNSPNVGAECQASSEGKGPARSSQGRA